MNSWNWIWWIHFQLKSILLRVTSIVRWSKTTSIVCQVPFVFAVVVVVVVAPPPPWLLLLLLFKSNFAVPDFHFWLASGCACGLVDSAVPSATGTELACLATRCLCDCGCMMCCILIFICWSCHVAWSVYIYIFQISLIVDKEREANLNVWLHLVATYCSSQLNLNPKKDVN